MNTNMKLEVVTRNQLHTFMDTITKQRDEQMISRIVHQVYEMVLASAKKGMISVKWSSDEYFFDNFMEYTPLHVIRACVRIQELFPDSEVLNQNSLREITVNWV